MNQITKTTDTSKIVGWGHDADRQNNPTYPMRDRDAQDARGERGEPVQRFFPGGVAGAGVEV